MWKVRKNMKRSNDRFFERFSLADVTEASQRLSDVMAEMKSAHIGEASVISRQVHIIYPGRPQILQVLLNSDAGQVFYHRKAPSEVLHIDVFHQKGIVDPKQVAENIGHAIFLLQEQFGFSKTAAYLNPNWVDIQTGAGGGRITGLLCYGKKPALRQIHETHVHITLMLPTENMVGIFFVVHAAEQAILGSKLELRRIEKIVPLNNAAGEGMDMQQYSTDTDSMLTEKNEFVVSPEKKLASIEQEPDRLADQTAADTPTAMGINEPKTDHSLPNGTPPRCRTSDAQVLVGMEKVPIFTRILHFFLKQNRGHAAEKQNALIIDKLVKDLTILKNTDGCRNCGQSTEKNLKPSSNSDDKGENKRIDKMHRGELTLSETVHAAACRMIKDPSAIFSIQGKDLRYCSPAKKKHLDLCLLLDASASMEGTRLETAKNLARRLFCRIPGRMGVITFQENTAQVSVSLTRSRSQLEQGLGEIAAFGRTPLALGINAGIACLQKTKSKRTVVILVTDGLADNVNGTMRQSLQDARAAARNVKKHGYPFIVIGLKPHQDYLLELTRESGGKLYIVDEFNERLLSEPIDL